MRYVKAFAAAVFVCLVAACSSGKSPGPLEGTWQTTGDIPTNITFRDGEMEVMGLIVTASYTFEGNEVVVTSPVGSSDPGNTYRYTMNGPDSISTEHGNMRRVRLDSAPAVTQSSAPAADLYTVATEPKKPLSLSEIQTKYNNKPYGVVRAQLSASGYSPDKTADSSIFNMSVAGDPAACGTKGCQIPWAGDNEKLCIGVSVDDNLTETNWNANISMACD